MTQQQIKQMRVNSTRRGLTMYGEYTAGAMDASEWQRKKDIRIMRQWLEREYAYNGSMAVITPDMIDEICKAMEDEL